MSTDNTLSMQQTFDLFKTYSNIQVYIGLSKKSCCSFIIPSSAAVIKKKTSGSMEIIVQKGSTALIIDEEAKIYPQGKDKRTYRLLLDAAGSKLELLLF